MKQKKPLSRSIGIRRTPQATTPTPNAATQVQSSWIMPDFAFLCTTDAWNIRYGFGRLRHSRPLAATSCHLIANPLFHANNGFTLQAKRIINTKISIRNECSNYFERKVRRDGRQAQPPVRPGNGSAVGWITKRSANSCASVRVPCRRSATTVRWLTLR